MGCGNSKKVFADENAKVNSTVTSFQGVQGSSPRDVASHNDSPQGEPFLENDCKGASFIKGKINAANDLTLSMTKHVHELGTVNIIENPFDEAFTEQTFSDEDDSIKGAEDPEDVFVDDSQFEDEPLPCDLVEIRNILKEMLNTDESNIENQSTTGHRLEIFEDVSEN